MQVSAGRRCLLCAGLTAPTEACVACLLSQLSRSVQCLTAHVASCGDTNTRMQWTDTHTSAAADTCHLFDKVFIAVQSDMFLNCHQLMSTPQTI